MARPFRLPPVFCHELQLYDLFFGEVTLSSSSYVKLFMQRKGLLFIILCTVLLYATDPPFLRFVFGPILGIVIWCLCVLFYLSMMFVLLCIGSVIKATIGLGRVYVPIATLTALAVVFFTMRAGINQIIALPLEPWLFQIMFNIALTVIILEAVFFRFIIPYDFALIALKAAKPALVKIGDRKLPISNIKYMVAQEHYLNISLPNETLTIRARLGDAIAQTSPEQGMQPHRSWWISKAAEPKMDQQNGKPVLRLSDDTVVPIAKARQHDVQDWLDLNAS